jgi:demethylmenaquinone methyltransferase/2-methoxy-6-polyprenyl-1,4-benzoquinol methylase
MPAPEEKNEAERIAQVRGIFSSIPRWYDFLNHFLSLRRDVAWRRFAVRRMRFFRTNAFLDVATGTGDLAIEAARAHPEVRVTGIDFVPSMLKRGKEKIEKMGLEMRINLLEGDALALPFEDDSFDVAAIAFGIRNIPDREGALREMARVVVPGGTVMVLELTTPRRGPIRALYRIYLNGLLPVLGRIVSGDPRAYRYLAESIMEFPSPEEFSGIMRGAGLLDVKAVPLTLGVARLHTGSVGRQ